MELTIRTTECGMVCPGGLKALICDAVSERGHRFEVLVLAIMARVDDKGALKELAKHFRPAAHMHNGPIACPPGETPNPERHRKVALPDPDPEAIHRWENEGGK